MKAFYGNTQAYKRAGNLVTVTMGDAKKPKRTFQPNILFSTQPITPPDSDAEESARQHNSKHQNSTASGDGHIARDSDLGEYFRLREKIRDLQKRLRELEKKCKQSRGTASPTK